MWHPNEEGVKELIGLLQECNSPDNNIQSEIYNKDFSNYLIFIFTHSEIKIEIRQYAGLILKGMMERQFAQLNDENIEYFKIEIIKKFNDSNKIIQRTTSNLINAFVRLGGIDLWPELFDILINNLYSDNNYDSSIETIQTIIEDSGSYIEDKKMNFLKSIIQKILDVIQITIEQIRNNKINENSILITLSSLNTLFEYCPNAIFDQKKIIAQNLINLNNLEHLDIRISLGICWNSLFRNNKELLNELHEQVDNNINKLIIHFAEKITTITFSIIPNVINCMKITENDVYEIDNKTNEHIFGSKEEQEVEDSDNYENENKEKQYYNPNWTLRKCASKLYDRISIIFPKLTFDYSRNLFETDLQSQEWMIKEKAILALGACAHGCYEFLKPSLSTVISFLLKELKQSNKFIKVITFWTLSRFTLFITKDNQLENCLELFREYLYEILICFLDSDSIVREASISAFSVIVVTSPEKIEPFLFDVFNIIKSVIEKFNGICLLNIYEILILLTENYTEYFKIESLSNQIIQCVINKSYGTIKSYNTNLDYSDNTYIFANFDLIIALLKAAGDLMKLSIEELLERTMDIVVKNYEFFLSNNKEINSIDKDLINKCLDFISHIYDTFPELMLNYSKKFLILEYLLKFFEIDDNYLNPFCITLIGEMGCVDNAIFQENIIYLINAIIKYIEIPQLIKQNNMNIIPDYMLNISLCNNSCVTIGSLIISYPNSMKDFIHPIMKKLLIILSLPRLNKSLAQNICICIGKCSIMFPEIISLYIEEFLKQFCLSLRNIKHSPEKQTAFVGLCKCLAFNPNSLRNYFAFFCDAICNYENPPLELESMFQNVIEIFKTTLNEKWFDYLKLFPEKLKIKMANRFKLN